MGTTPLKYDARDGSIELTYNQVSRFASVYWQTYGIWPSVVHIRTGLKPEIGEFLERRGFTLVSVTRIEGK